MGAVRLYICQLLVLFGHLCAPIELNIGVIMPRGNISYAGTIAYETNAGALHIGREAVDRLQLLNNITFNFIFRSGNCSDIVSTGVAAELILKSNVSAIIGPPCMEAIRAVIPLVTYYDIATFAWGLASSSSVNLRRYASAITMTSTGRHFALALHRVVRHFQWDQFALLYYGEKCGDFQQEMIDVIYDYGGTYLSRTATFSSLTKDGMSVALERTSTIARIIALCVPDSEAARDFMLIAYDNNLLTEEYVYIILDMQSYGYAKQGRDGTIAPIWKDTHKITDGRDVDAKTAFSKTLMISVEKPGHEALASFKVKVVERMRHPPFNCVEECSDPAFEIGSDNSDQLYDIVLLYSIALNRTIERDPAQLQNGSKVLMNSQGTFAGVAYVRNQQRVFYKDGSFNTRNLQRPYGTMAKGWKIELKATIG